MAILFITHKFPPGIGGMQKQSYELINGARKNTKVHTIIQSPTESKITFFLKLKYRIKRMLKEYSDIEAIHCNDAVVACACIWIKKKYSIPLTATFHGLDIVFSNLLFQKHMVPKLWLLNRVFAVSHATRNECLKRGFRPDQVIEIRNGVDHEIMSSKRKDDFLSSFALKHNLDLEGKRILLSVGRSVKRKGFSWFAKNVMPELPPDVDYLIVGPRSNSKAMSHKLLQLLPPHFKKQIELFLGYPSDDEELDCVLENSKTRTSHLGVMPWSELTELLSYASIFIMPNIPVDGDMEGFGLVGLEANLCETFVAAADIEGITSAIIHDRNGILIPTQAEDAWITNLIELLEFPNRLSEKGKEAKYFVQANYSWDRMARQYLKEFEKLARVETYRLDESRVKVA